MLESAMSFPFGGASQGGQSARAMRAEYFAKNTPDFGCMQMLNLTVCRYPQSANLLTEEGPRATFAP
jgi:hypothetical protein